MEPIYKTNEKKKHGQSSGVWSMDPKMEITGCYEIVCICRLWNICSKVTNGTIVSCNVVDIVTL